MFQNIMVASDLSEPSEQALKWALFLGKKFRSPIKIVNSSQPEEGINLKPTPAEMKGLLYRKIEELQAKLELTSSDFTSLTIESSTAPAATYVLDQIRDESPDLVVVGTHGFTGLKHLRMGSFAERLVRHSPSPVLVAKQAPAGVLKKIVVPVDFSEFTENAIDLAADLCREIGASLELIHICALPDLAFASGEMGTPLSVEILETMEKNAMEELKRLQTRYRDLTVQIQVLTGRPAEEIIEWAQKSGAHLIVIPTHGRSGVKRFLMGSTAELVIRYAPCSVLAFVGGKAALQRKALLSEEFDGM